MTMTKEEILEGLKESFATINPKQDLSDVKPETKLLEGMGLDSLSMLLMSLAIENKFNVRIEDGARFDKVGDVIDLIAGEAK